jgi:hypothetical protein
MSKAPDNAMRRYSVVTSYDPFEDEAFGTTAVHSEGEFVLFEDASRLLAEKDAELQRLREAAWKAVAALERTQHATEADRLTAAGALRAALNP